MSMLKKLGKQYAREIAQKVEEVTLQALNEHNPQNVTTEETTEKLHTITGKRKALYIGINYVGQKNALRGCVNDVVNIKKFFEKHYPIDESMVLTDDPETEP